jgi:hypothetical protein
VNDSGVEKDEMAAADYFKMSADQGKQVESHCMGLLFGMVQELLKIIFELLIISENQASKAIQLECSITGFASCLVRQLRKSRVSTIRIPQCALIVCSLRPTLSPFVLVSCIPALLTNLRLTLF